MLPATAGTDVIDMESSWSPDGSKLAFRRIGNNDSDIVIVTLSTQAVTRIHMDGVQSYPAWSPDGASIAFSSSHENPMSDIYDDEARRDRAGSADERRGFPLASTLGASSRSGCGRTLGVGSTGSESF